MGGGGGEGVRGGYCEEAELKLWEVSRLEVNLETVTVRCLRWSSPSAGNGKKTCVEGGQSEKKWSHSFCGLVVFSSKMI